MILQDVWFVGLMWDWFKAWCNKSWFVGKVFDESSGHGSFEVWCGMYVCPLPLMHMMV